MNKRKRKHISFLFFFNDTATTEIYTLSLHDALPISQSFYPAILEELLQVAVTGLNATCRRDRKSTRLNSSHGYISYAVFCLKKKKIFSRNRRYTNKRKSKHNSMLSNQTRTVRTFLGL